MLIATAVTVRVVPLNFTEYEESGLARPLDFPNVENEDPSKPNRAKSKQLEECHILCTRVYIHYYSTGFPIDRRDFSIDPIEVTFQPDNSTTADLTAIITIFDDDINEVEEEIFVLVLQLVTATEPSLVDFSERNATLARIVDNDGNLCVHIYSLVGNYS